MGQVYLPFGLQWFEENAPEKVTGYGEPDCSATECHWMAERPEGTVILTQAFHEATLVGFGMQYILVREAGLPYEEKVKELRRKLEADDWVVTDAADPLMGIVIPSRSFRAESKDTRMEVNYKDGEYTVTVTLEMRTK
jgi:hypothetical protein